MARLTSVAKAQKSPGSCGKCSSVILKGEPYYWWSNMVGSRGVRRIRCSKCRPRPSELVGSDKISRIMGAVEQVEDSLGQLVDVISGNPKSFTEFRDDVANALQDASQEIGSVGEEYGESFDNMPEGLQQGETGQRCEEMRDNCSDWACQLEDAANTISDMETPETKPTDIPDVQDIIDAANDALSAVEV